MVQLEASRAAAWEGLQGMGSAVFENMARLQRDLDDIQARAEQMQAHVCYAQAAAAGSQARG